MYLIVVNMPKYLLYKASHKSFLAFNIVFSEKLLKLFPAITWKKKLVKLYLYIASKFRCEFKGVEFCDDFHLNSNITIKELLLDHGEALGAKDPVLVMWNRGENRQGRVYIWRFSHDCELKSFIKLVDDESSRYALKREMGALEFLSSTSQKFRHPEVIQYKELGKSSLLETTAVPLNKSNSHIIDFSKLNAVINSISDIAPKKENFLWTDICNEDWGKKLQLFISPEASAHLNSKLDKAFFSMGFIHGDFGSENLYDCNGEIWIIDWEASTTQGPVLVDYIAFWLGRNDKNNTEQFIDDFYSKFIKSSCYRREDVVAAILFLSAYEFPPALKLFSFWNSQNFSQLL